MRMICAFLFALGALFVMASPLIASSVTPYVIYKEATAHPDCQYICAGCYSQLKDDSPPHPVGEVHTISDSQLIVTITCITVNDDDEMMSFDWSANIPVSAVIVKSSDANVYAYDPAVTSDTDLGPPEQNAVSHITFCYTPQTITYTVTWGATLGINQQMIADWATHPTQFTQPFGELTVSVTATVDYDLGIYYTVDPLSDFSPPSGATPLSFEYSSGIWKSIPPQGTTQTLPLPSGVGTNEHTYPMRVDLALLGTGDQTAGDSITFQVHVVATASAI